MTGNENNRLKTVTFGELLLQGETIEPRELDIEDEAGWTRMRFSRQILGGTGKSLDRIVLRGEEVSETGAHRFVVVYHEDSFLRLFHGATSAMTGREKATQAPPPSALTADISPLWEVIMERAMVRPMPKPSRLVEKNRSKICSGASAGSPTPKS